MKCKECEYSCGCIETCKLKSSECYQNKKSRMKDIRKKAIKFEAEMYGFATNPFVDGFVNGYEQGKADGIDMCIALFREWQPRLATNVAEFGDALEQLKERK